MTAEATDTAIEQFGRAPDNLPSVSDEAPERVSDFGNVRVDVVDFAHKADRRRFLNVAAPLYKHDANYIEPLRIGIDKFLDPAKNPAYDHIDVHPMIAYRNGRPVGRMTVQIDREYEEANEKRVGFFGFFESIDDRRVAHALFDQGIRWLRERGCVEVLGPANFNLTHNSGLLVKNFDRPPFVEQLYNPPYYEELVTSFGFGKAKDFYVWYIDIRDGMASPNRARIEKIAERIQRKEGITFRSVDLKNFAKEVDSVHDIFTAAWEKNWGFAPISKKEFEWICEDIASIVVPELIIFAQVDGRDVGFALTVPNVNERLPRSGKLFPFGWTGLLNLKKTQAARLYLLGLKKEYRKRGLESVLFRETLERARQKGMTGGEIGWTLEDNHLINRAIESMDGWLDRIYRIYGMTL
mgnify:CR=1 FL=1